MTVESKLQNDTKLWDCWLQKYEQRVRMEMEVKSDSLSEYHTERLKIMKENNPR